MDVDRGRGRSGRTSRGGRSRSYYGRGSSNFGGTTTMRNEEKPPDGLAQISQIKCGKGDGTNIRGLVYDVDRDCLLSITKNGALATWDNRGERIGDDHDTGCEARALFKEGEFVFVGGADGSVRWVNLANGVSQLFHAHQQPVTCFAVGSDMLLTGSKDKLIRAWQWNNDQSNFILHGTLEGHIGAIETMIMGGKFLFSGGSDKIVFVWDMTTGQQLQQLQGHRSMITAMVLFNGFLLSSDVSGKILVWGTDAEGKFEEKSMLQTTTKKTDSINEGIVAMRGCIDHEQKPILICSRMNQSIQFYELPTFQKRGEMRARSLVRSLESMTTSPIFFLGNEKGFIEIYQYSSPAR